jgi:hypothetical protein
MKNEDVGAGMIGAGIGTILGVEFLTLILIFKATTDASNIAIMGLFGMMVGFIIAMTGSIIGSKQS